ncbi:hypothetical protein IPdc08_01062 [archaeon]|nr:hypothetical protein IPdc08_01062 [archaeon]
MPEIRCVNCGMRIYIDAMDTLYEGEVGYPNCGTKVQVYVSQTGSRVERKYPSYTELKEIWEILSEVEKKSISEASFSLGAGAYTASEMMSLRCLESILRRIYGTNEMLGKLIERMEKDNKLSDLKGILSYFKDVRNRVAHPDKISSKLEAESTVQMTKRLLIEIVKRLYEGG